MEIAESIQKLKDIINKNKKFILENYPKKDTNEYLFISAQLKKLFYFLFDLEELELECMMPGCKLDYFILSQSDGEKLYNTTFADNYDKVYFYPWLSETLSKINEMSNLVNQAFIDAKK